MPELQKEEDRGSFKYVPGLFKPWTFDLSVVAARLQPLGVRDLAAPQHAARRGGRGGHPQNSGVHGLVVRDRIGDLGDRFGDGGSTGVSDRRGATISRRFTSRPVPKPWPLSANSCRVTTKSTMCRWRNPGAGLARRTGSRCLSSRGIEAEWLSARTCRLPFGKMRRGLSPTTCWRSTFAASLTCLFPVSATRAWDFSWGWKRPDLIRYNRVEGPSVGGRFNVSPGGPYTLGISGFFGLADLQPKLRLDLERATPLRRLSLGAFRELRPTDPAGGYLGFGNSVDAFFFGRDNGEYFRATGFDIAWRPPTAARESFVFRAYGERQEPVLADTDFALFHAFDDDWKFRPQHCSSRY